MRQNGKAQKTLAKKQRVHWQDLPKCLGCGRVLGWNRVGVQCRACFDERIEAPNT